MFKKIKELALTVGVLSLIATPLLIPVAVSAATTNIGNCVTTGTDLSADTNCSDSASSATSQDGTSIDGILTLVVNIFSIIVGFVAVIMIIVGGLKYITSNGDSSNISGAKNTIVFAIVGLVIVALAQVIVHFVLAKVANAGSST